MVMYEEMALPYTLRGGCTNCEESDDDEVEVASFPLIFEIIRDGEIRGAVFKSRGLFRELAEAVTGEGNWLQPEDHTHLPNRQELFSVAEQIERARYVT